MSASQQFIRGMHAVSLMATSQRAKQPILVTGSNRSGSTWVGSMLGLSPALGYINEPLKLKYRAGMCAFEFERWFTYISAENEALYLDAIRRMMAFRFNLRADIQQPQRPHSLAYTFKTFGLWQLYRLFGVQPLLKDPVAVFSAEWFEATFDTKVIVMIRHPAAFVSSLKRYNHTFPFAHFAEQPLLMDRFLSPFAAEIHAQAHQPSDIIDQAILLWNCIYHTVIGYKQRHPDWFFLRHEDVSAEPLHYFQKLYQFCSVELTPTIESRIQQFSSPQNPTEIPLVKGHHHIHLDSKANIQNWKKRLTAEEIRRIYMGTQRVASVFYTDDEW